MPTKPNTPWIQIPVDFLSWPRLQKLEVEVESALTIVLEVWLLNKHVLSVDELYSAMLSPHEVEALLQTGFLHRTEEAPQVCSRCFPSPLRSKSKKYAPGLFVVHDYPDFAYQRLLNEERGKIRKTLQNARKARFRSKLRGSRNDSQGYRVKETTRQPYRVRPTQGLRKAPSRVWERLSRDLDRLEEREDTA